ncbi:MAG: hypothetical protein A4E51_01763 [Methanosaeta sp. PtaU1.Bin055]|nr:MAG: hypothetical protein A4E51_01763 [Methanosaeta sp. PtaU1.Bin055]
MRTYKLSDLPAPKSLKEGRANPSDHEVRSSPHSGGCRRGLRRRLAAGKGVLRGAAPKPALPKAHLVLREASPHLRRHREAPGGVPPPRLRRGDQPVDRRGRRGEEAVRERGLGGSGSMFLPRWAPAPRRRDLREPGRPDEGAPRPGPLGGGGRRRQEDPPRLQEGDGGGGRPRPRDLRRPRGLRRPRLDPPGGGLPRV